MTGDTMATWVGAVIFAAACTPKATDDELNKMCNNLVKLQDEISPLSAKELMAEEEARFVKEEARLKVAKATHLQEWDSMLQTRLAQAATLAESDKKMTQEKKDEEKAALEAELAKKKEMAVAKYDPEIAALGGKKKAAIDAAKKMGEENQAAWKKAVGECVDKAKAEGVSQELAKCRIKVDNIGHYFKRCK